MAKWILVQGILLADFILKQAKEIKSAKLSGCYHHPVILFCS